MSQLILKEILKKRVFTYRKRGVSLNFELNEDIQEIKDFKNLLIEARKDIEKILEYIKE